MGGFDSGILSRAASGRRRRLIFSVVLGLGIVFPAVPLAAPTPALAATYASTVLADSPKAYYRLNESGCCTAADASGNGYNATYASSGISYSATGALTADSDSAITTSYNGAAVSRDAAFLPTGAAARTIELWEKTSTAGSFGLVSYGTVATNQYVSLGIGSGQILSLDGYTNYVNRSAPYSLEDGRWHHLAASFDGTTAFLYIDGQQIGSGALPLATVTGQALWLGSTQDGAAVFPGSLDEVAIYPSALTAAQISAHWRAAIGVSCPSVPTTGYAGTVAADHPTRYFRLGETSGSVAADSSSSTNCRPAAYNAGVGHPSSGALVSDANGSVSSPSPAALTASGSVDGLPGGSSARTLEAWEKASTTGTFGIISYGNPVTNQYATLGITNTTISFDAYTNRLNLTTAYPLEDGSWHHVVATFDGVSTAAVYLDGQQLGTGSLSPSTSLSQQGLWIGNAQDGASPFQGSLDEIAIYPAALSPSQVNAHWRAGLAVACPAVPTSGYPGAVASDHPTRYFRLGETAGAAAMEFAGGSSCRAAAYAPGVTHTRGAIVADSNGSVGGPSPADLSVFGSVDGLPAGGSARTFEIWERASTSGTFGLISYGTATNNQYATLGITNTSVSFDAYWNYVMLSSPHPLEDGGWHHLVATFDGTSTVTLYVDGSSIGTGTLSPSTPLTQGLWIGKAQDGATPFQGSLDEVAIYSSALSAARVAAHYNAGAPIGGPLTPTQTAAGGSNCSCHTGPTSRGNATPSPVDTNTGNFWHVFSDLGLAGRGYPLAFTRTYNSQSAGTNSPTGYGWQSNYGMSLAQSGGTVTITQENGSQVSFTQSGSSWAPAAPRFIATLTQNGDGTWTFVRQARDTYTFSPAGQLVAETDLNGYTTTFAYSGGNLATITDPSGRSLSLGWTGANITSVTDANVTPSRVVQFQYNDGAGNLTDVIDVNAGHSQFTYDTSHRMTVMKDPKCYATTGCLGVQNSYDSNGRVQWQKDQLNRQTSFSYGTNQTTVTDPKGNQTVDYYNQGLRVATTRGYGTTQAATWQYAYDPSTLALIGLTDPNGNQTSYTVDGSGNQLTATDPLGRQTRNTYNSLNQLLTSQDPNLVTTTNVYDSRGNLTSVSRPLTGSSQVQTTTYNHTDNAHPGDVTSMVDPDTKTWLYGYDAYGNRSSTTDPLTDRATSVFNADGWMTSSVSPKGNVSGCGCQATYTTSYAHDAFGNVTTVTDPLGHQTIRHYDADQNLDWSQDGKGNKTTYVYDLANQQTQVQRPDTTTPTTDYFADGTVQDQKDGKNNAILTYGYDSLARVNSMTDALSNVTSYGYDNAGNRLTQQDPGGNCLATPKVGCTSFTYDVANELKSISYSDGVTPNVSNITYDSDGQRTSMTDGTGTSTWAWDSLHRLTSYTNGAGAQVQYGYNLRNLATTITYPGSLTVTRGYDNAGRFTSVQDWLSNNTSFGYDPNSNLTTETLPAASGVVDNFSFDAADRLMAIADTNGANALFSATYTRDNANQLTSDSSQPSSTGSYRYTTMNQVCYAGAGSTSACTSPPSGSIPYAYDAADNLTQMGTTQQVFNNADQLCWTGSTSGSCASPPTGATSYGYDTRGNRTTVTPPAGGSTTLTYDQANRLTAYGTAGTYAYNGDGLRMSKTVSGTNSQYLWDASAGLPLVIKDGSTAYVYGPGGLPLEQINGSTALWLHHDQLGSTRLVTNRTGSSVATYTFDPYGKLTATTGTTTNPMRFAGQYLDTESAMYYLRARYYEPGTGQLSTSDPMTALTREPYGYVAGNPMNASDPSGLVTKGLCLHTPSIGRGGYVGGEVCLQFAQGPNGVQFGFSESITGGRGTPSATLVGAGKQISNGNTISDLGGPFGTLGGSVGEAATVGLDGFIGRNGCDRLIVGAEASVSLGIKGPVPAEIHGGASDTATQTPVNIDSHQHPLLSALAGLIGNLVFGQ
ncbi:MAG: DUF6531 domain-containing protein [Actinomycetota bacterium]|nr:DUF6531 domain-containing protein [Actinomycetota bacterium]